MYTLRPASSDERAEAAAVLAVQGAIAGEADAVALLRELDRRPVLVVDDAAQVGEPARVGHLVILESLVPLRVSLLMLGEGDQLDVHVPVRWQGPGRLPAHIAADACEAAPAETLPMLAEACKGLFGEFCDDSCEGVEGELRENGALRLSQSGDLFAVAFDDGPHGLILLAAGDAGWCSATVEL